MGSAHSVHILMMKNMQRILQILTFRWRSKAPLPSSGAEALTEMQREWSIQDEKEKTQTPVSRPVSAKKVTRQPRTPQAFLELARQAKAALKPVIVVLHCFAGAARDGDVEHWLHWWGGSNGHPFPHRVDRHLDEPGVGF